MPSSWPITSAKLKSPFSIFLCLCHQAERGHGNRQGSPVWFDCLLDWFEHMQEFKCDPGAHLAMLCEVCQLEITVSGQTFPSGDESRFIGLPWCGIFYICKISVCMWKRRRNDVNVCANISAMLHKFELKNRLSFNSWVWTVIQMTTPHICLSVHSFFCSINHSVTRFFLWFWMAHDPGR